MPTPERLDVDALRRWLISYRRCVHEHAPVLNLLNVYPVPDGDTGTNMARTLDAVVTEMDAASLELAATCDAISHGSLMGARGNSGVILSQILRGVANTLKQAGADRAGADRAGGAPTGGAPGFAAALAAATAGAYQAVLTPVEGTILTVVRESADAATAAAGAGASLVDAVEAAHAAGQHALARTPDLLPALRDAGVVDAGGAGYLLFLDAALHVLVGRPLPEPQHVDAPDTAGRFGPTGQPRGAAAGARRVGGAAAGLDVSEQRYEVMYLCDLDDARIDELKRGWGAIGDSIVVVGGDGLWNCHVHTNDIGAAIEAALDLDGRPHDIRVTDLFEEVADEHAHRDAALRVADPAEGSAMPAGPADPDGPADQDGLVLACAAVAVASGAGLDRLFRDLGVGAVVTGGQTCNPSTAELLDAVGRVGADGVVILPNNKNIIAVAEQVDALTPKSVRVVPTRSMPEALAALVVFDPEADPDTNQRTMTAAAESVATGEVTQAVRASRSASGPVRAGDWIGLGRGEGIVSVAADVQQAATALLGHLVDADREIVTILTGAEADPDVTAAIVGWLADERSDLEVEVHDGGQPLYPYLFGVE